MKQNDLINLLFGTTAGPQSEIVFGATRFSAPSHFPPFIAPFGGGLYAILVPDATARPRQFRAIYFGQAGEFRQRVTNGHEKYQDWLREAGTAFNLYVSFYSMLGNENERIAIEQQLIQMYQPICNVANNPRGVLAREFQRLLAQRR